MSRRLQADGPGYWRCKCGQRFHTMTPGKVVCGCNRINYHEPQPAEAYPCEYRGELDRYVKSNVCGMRGTPEAVYTCVIKGECVIRSARGLQSCLRCEHLPV